MSILESTNADDKKALHDCYTWLNSMFPENVAQPLRKHARCMKATAPVTVAPSALELTKRALLLTTDGRMEIIRITSPGQCSQYTGGYSEYLRVPRGYTYDGRNEYLPRPRLVCVGNTSPSCAPNPWSLVVNIFTGRTSHLHGNIVLMSEDPSDGSPMQINPYITGVFNEILQQKDKGTFLRHLRDTNHVTSYI